MTTHTEQNNGLISQHGNIWLCSIRNTAEAPLNGVWSEEEGSYASCFYCWFLESFKSCLLLPVALPSLIDTLVQLLAWRSMLWLSMTMWQQKYLTQNDFLSMHNMDCWSDLWHYIFVSVRRSLPLWWKEIHAHKHTHTHTVQKQLCFATLYKSHWDGCSPVNLLHIFRTTFPKNTSGWLLLIQAT